MVAELIMFVIVLITSCSLAKISMVAEQEERIKTYERSCSLAKISMVAEPFSFVSFSSSCCSLAKISMVAELKDIKRF